MASSFSTGAVARSAAGLSDRALRTIIEIVYASYGTPGGNCTDGFNNGGCHADNSLQIVKDTCIGCPLCAQVCPVGAIPFRPYERHEIDTG